MPKVVRAGAVSHVGRVRSNNQDSGFIGKHVYGVADGMGGHAGGDVASSIAVRHLAENDQLYDTVEEAKQGLTEALLEANSLITEAVEEHSELRGMGTTADLITRVDDEMVIAHIGDSRVYRFHEGELEQVTIDHTFVQRLVDAGRITPEEALVHPRRSVLMRVLGDVETNPDVDTYVVPAVEGDRWLLCSDGLSSYAEESQIAEVLARTVESSREVADDLVQIALDNGAPDNVTVVVLELGNRPLEPMRSRIVGAAANPLKYASRAPRRAKRILPDMLQSSRRLAQLPEREEFVPPSDEFLQQLVDEERRRKRWRRITWAAAAIVLLGVMAGASALAYSWTQQQYYVGTYEDQVAIYQGVQATLGPWELSTMIEESDISVDDLPAYQHMQVTSTIPFSSLDEARALVERLEDAVKN
ncbi:PP2C family protein-serine/threonine phosphatase [Gulosibacter molinativorax]|uniref:Serine/threonine-protein phosphatase n=1 Tax=Gulosibacter molinativorax TaxID=256821 RepID=A0ABT7C9D2_9MICO|nr:PP2C family serine/threonine-protein phosphatase [Gulosibacter molinativorax]MDJ1371251.1 serine/threonine-protein phosphatase [Gulosibacter molinativorax]QUY63067.1 PP2C-family Ser/Thr phosphatase [Gulosibacter molinativorax]